MDGQPAQTVFYFCRYYNTPYNITTSRLDFSVWKRMKNLAINLQPLIYGAFPVCRNYTVRAHLRNPGAGERHGCENRQQYARTLRRGLHSPHLHPRNQAEAGRGRTNDGQLHGAGDVSRSKREERTEYPSAPLSTFPSISACGSRCGSGG